MKKLAKSSKLEELAALVLNVKSNSVLVAIALGHDSLRRIELVVGLSSAEISKIINHLTEFGLVKNYQGSLNRFKVDREFSKSLMNGEKVRSKRRAT